MFAADVGSVDQKQRYVPISYMNRKPSCSTTNLPVCKLTTDRCAACQALHVLAMVLVALAFAIILAVFFL